MDKAILGIVSSIIAGLVKSFENDLPTARKVLDKWIDVVEKEIEDSSNKFDDAAVKPILSSLRSLLSISETPGSEYEDK